VSDTRDIRIGDVVQTRKAHPCGSNAWTVYRIGADIGVRCNGCDRRVLMPRRDFEKAVKKIVSRAEDTAIHTMDDTANFDSESG
jgi:hypothetical protein